MTAQEKRVIIGILFTIFAFLMVVRSCNKTVDSVQLSQANYKGALHQIEVFQVEKKDIENEISKTQIKLDSLFFVRDSVNIKINGSTNPQLQRGLDTLFNY
jgi:hypothetical protein